MPNINGGPQDDPKWAENNVPIDKKQKIVALIKSSVSQSARDARENAGYAGSMDDGGASQMTDKLTYWLDGIHFATTGVTRVYSTIVKDFERTQDPEYQEFLRLKEKFKDIQ